MSMRIFIIGLTIATILFGGTVQAATDKEVSQSIMPASVKIQKTGVRINIERRFYETSNSFVDAEIPIISGLSDIKYQEDLNDRLRLQADKDE